VPALLPKLAVDRVLVDFDTVFVAPGAPAPDKAPEKPATPAPVTPAPVTPAPAAPAAPVAPSK
jgi:hypothetical protein